MRVYCVIRLAGHGSEAGQVSVYLDIGLVAPEADSEQQVVEEDGRREGRQVVRSSMKDEHLSGQEAARERLVVRRHGESRRKKEERGGGVQEMGRTSSGSSGVRVHRARSVLSEESGTWLNLRLLTHQACRISPDEPTHNRFKHDTAGKIHLRQLTGSPPLTCGSESANSRYGTVSHLDPSRTRIPKRPA